MHVFVLLFVDVDDHSCRVSRECRGAERFKDVSFEWERLDRRGYKAPYVPKIKDSLDTSNFDPYPEDEAVKPYKGDQSIFEEF